MALSRAQLKSVEAITGHDTDEMVNYYGRKVRRIRLAQQAMDLMIQNAGGTLATDKTANPLGKLRNLTNPETAND